MSVLVTGATGFVGKHLVDLLLDKGLVVLATGISSKSPPTPGVQFIEIDLTDASQVKKIPLKSVEAVIHLAGLAAVGPSFEEPAKYVSVNSIMQINLYEAFRKINSKPKFIVVSSGAVYKNPQSKNGLPLTEGSEILPTSPYAVSKLSQEAIARYYNQLGFNSIVARPFNHIGPGQGPGFITADIAKQITEAQKTGQIEIRVGNLKTKRDYTDVRDIVNAYYLLLRNGQAGETYNICSGRAISGEQLLASFADLSGTEIKATRDAVLFRPSDTASIYGSYSKLQKACGWQPVIPLETTLKDILSYWGSLAT